ncbi:sialin-like isoform X1 [Diabrotica undecimpunctata]|uniref:sialin-like isoform X1 n=1 Tax=Diabrotica undecimpunctata TaxID=50387 RepID=UPI003B63B602
MTHKPEGGTVGRFEESKREDISSSESIGSLWTFWRMRRYVVAVLAFLGFFTSYALRVNLSIAIVAMTEFRNVTLENGMVIRIRDFDWDTKLQGYILSSFFYGYITTQLLGGYLAARYGGKRVFGIGIAVTALLTLVTPWIARTNVYLLLAVRIIEGIFEGVTYPCIHAIWSRWAPPLERSRLATIAFSGSYIGTVVSMPLCSILASTLGWSSIFYFFGTVGLIWCLAWMVIVTDSPEDDRHITEQELKYIINSLEAKSSKKMKIPWSSFVTSMPVWAITVSHFSENWGFYTMLTQLPKFMKRVLNFNLQGAGFTSALPYLLMAIMTQFSGHFADWFIVKRILSVTQVRRIFNCSGFVAQTIFMMAATYWLTPVGTTFCISMAVGLGAFAWAGFSINHLDIAPQYASILMGFGNTFATIPGIVSPILTGYLVTDETSVDEWRIVFYISSAIYLFGALFYGLFVSGELQPWAKETEQLNTDNENYGASSIENGQGGYVNKSFEQDKNI